MTNELTHNFFIYCLGKAALRIQKPIRGFGMAGWANATKKVFFSPRLKEREKGFCSAPRKVGLIGSESVARHNNNSNNDTTTTETAALARSESVNVVIAA